MQALRNVSIRWQLMAIIMIISVIAVVLACVGFVIYDLQEMWESLQEQSATTARLVAQTNLAALTFNDSKAAEDSLRSLNDNPDIMQAFIYARDGSVLASYRRSGMEASPPTLPEQPGKGVLHNRRFCYLERIVFQGETLGSVYVESDLRDLMTHLRVVPGIMLGIMLLCLLTAFLLGSSLQRVVSGPILQLAGAAQEVSRHKDYSLRVAASGKDELAYLIEQFNGMLAEIEARDRELARHREQLEETVAARTAELQGAVKTSEETKERLRLVLEASNDGVWDWDIGSGRLTLNARWAEMLEYDLSELEHHISAFQRLVHPQDLDGVSAAWTAHFEQRTPFYEAEYRMRAKSGTWKWILAKGRVVERDEDGTVLRMVGRNTDVTARKQAEEALRQREERLKLLLSSTAEAIYGIDLKGECTFANYACLRMLGYEKEAELLGRNMHVVLHHSYADGRPFPTHECRIFRAFKVGQGSHVDDEVLWRKDGTSFPAEYWSYPIEEGGKLIGAVVTFLDITERRRNEEALKEAKSADEAASRAKSEFLANMSHEIRTPMNGILGMTELALDTELTPEQREYLLMVKSSADSLLTVINDILDFSKIEAGKMELQPIQFQLRDCIGDIMKALGLRAEQKGLELTYQIDYDIPEFLLGDPGRLRQVVVNLVANAIKFTEKGDIHLRITREQQEGRKLRLHFQVRDTGIGIATDKQSKIFGAFEQADGSTTRRYGGTGLGLTISQRLVSLMKGQIWVESEAGTGSVFHFTAELEALPEPPPPPEAIELSQLRDLPVLVVDDNATNRGVLSYMLREWQMRPAEADSGVTALKMLREEAPSGGYRLILLDSMMPGMDGFEVAENMGGVGNLAEITVMLLSSAGKPGDAARCRRLGISGYLLKPVKQSELLEAIRHVLGAKAKGDLVTRHSLREVRARRHVLVAEDNLVNQTLALRMLEKLGHTVEIAGDGRAVQKALEKRRFDLIFMDVQMPEMNGFEATAMIREKEKHTGGHIPIIAMTAHAMKGDRELCLQAGMDDYISKPVQQSELQEKLERYCPETAENKATGAAPKLDMESLQARFDNDLELLEEMCALFLSEAPRMVAAVRQAVVNGDANELRRAAHTVKGSAGIFGAERAVALAEELETLAGSGNLHDAERLVSTLTREMEGVQEAVGAIQREEVTR